MTAKEKDRVLRQIADNTHHSQIEGLHKCLYEFEGEELIKVIHATDKSIIRIVPLPKGRQFLDSGGYTAIARQKRRDRLRDALWFLAGIVVTKLCDILVQILSP